MAGANRTHLDDDTNAAAAIRVAADEAEEQLRSGVIPGKQELIWMWCKLMIIACIHCIVYTIILLCDPIIKHHMSSIWDWLFLFVVGGSTLNIYATLVIFHTVANYRATKLLQKAADLNNHPRRVFPYNCGSGAGAAETNKNISTSTSDDLPVSKDYCVIDNVVLFIKQRKKTKDDTKRYKTHCEILHFQPLTPHVRSSLEQAASKFKDFINEWFDIDPQEHVFTTSFLDHNNRVLIDWTRKSNIVASTHIQDQEQTTCCWAFSIADTVGTNYATSNSLVKSQKQFRCSPQDLVDWVIIVKKLLKRTRIDKYGTYTWDPKHAFEYVNEHGVSLLRNYKVTIQEREFKTNRGLKEFEAMREAKGPRIFIKYGNILRRDVSTGILSTDAVFKFLSRGVVHGSMEYCGGCSICKGFPAFDGIGVYDEPIHPEDHVFVSHGVMVFGIGNKEGTDYLRIRNSHGHHWPEGGPRIGCGDVNLKFFKKLYQVVGPEKRQWNGKEWVSMPV